MYSQSDNSEQFEVPDAICIYWDFFSDKQTLWDNLNLDKRFTHDILWNLRSEIHVKNSLESKLQKPFLSTLSCSPSPWFILLYAREFSLISQSWVEHG